MIRASFVKAKDGALLRKSQESRETKNNCAACITIEAVKSDVRLSVSGPEGELRGVSS